MNIFKSNTSICVTDGPEKTIQVIDQRFLPFEKKSFQLGTVEDAYFAIKEMVVRGAPLIGVTASYGIYLALLKYKGNYPYDHLKKSSEWLDSARPTAINLSYATKYMMGMFDPEKSQAENVALLFRAAENFRQNEIESCRLIGEHGFPIIQEIAGKKKGSPVQILTHCNAGWLACVEWGTALAPVYLTHRNGIPVHVWVDETRPRNQGARLTAFELGQAGVPHTVIADNTGGHLMQHGMVDLVIVGSDRTAANGDTANKIGTYLKALAAYDNGIPFYVALPASSFDLSIQNGVAEIPVEERGGEEVAFIEGLSVDSVCNVRLIPENSKAANYGFDVTPSRLITGFITEMGVCGSDKNSILKLFSDK